MVSGGISLGGFKVKIAARLFLLRLSDVDDRSC